MTQIFLLRSKNYMPADGLPLLQWKQNPGSYFQPCLWVSDLTWTTWSHRVPSVSFLSRLGHIDPKIPLAHKLWLWLIPFTMISHQLSRCDSGLYPSQVIKEPYDRGSDNRQGWAGTGRNVQQNINKLLLIFLYISSLCTLLSSSPSSHCYF